MRALHNPKNDLLQILKLIAPGFLSSPLEYRVDRLTAYSYTRCLPSLGHTLSVAVVIVALDLYTPPSFGTILSARQQTISRHSSASIPFQRTRIHSFHF